MAEILLFHHAQGQTEGILDFDQEVAALLEKRTLAFLEAAG
jgi:hypothetical protein